MQPFVLITLAMLLHDNSLWINFFIFIVFVTMFQLPFPSSFIELFPFGELELDPLLFAAQCILGSFIKEFRRSKILQNRSLDRISKGLEVT